MSSLSFSYITRITFSHSIRRHNVLLRCLPVNEPFQRVITERLCMPECFWYREGTDGFGNRIISGGTTVEHDSLVYSCNGIAEMSTYCIPDTTPHPMYFLSSLLTRTTPDILELMPQLTHDVLTDALAIAHVVYKNISYTSGVTSMSTTASETLHLHQGVCQDYAHLMISLCRAAGYAARYVCGLMMGEGMTHAWVEVYDGQCWYAFDPTNDTAVAYGYVKLAHGRDVLDCPVVRGLYQGACEEISLTEVVVKQES